MWVNLLLLTAILITTISGETAVLILARGGSKGVHLKNLRTVGGLTLLTRAILTARNAGLPNITVSTDHPLIALQTIKDNATIFYRSPVTATDRAPSIWGAAEFITSRPDITVLILMQVTSPFIRPLQLRNAVKKISNPNIDCVFSATRSYKLRWSINQGKLSPANFKIDARVRRQDWDGEFLETGAFYIARRRLIEDGIFQNSNCAVVEVSNLESFEVDTLEDLQIANAVHNLHDGN